MKLLLIYCTEFAFKPVVKTLDFVPVREDEESYKNIQAVFIHMEKEDEEREVEVARKLVKNVKWIARKNGTEKIILHSFAHLSNSKADPEFTAGFFDRIEERLKGTGFDVSQTPFGYFLDLKVDAPGYSTARVFKDI